MDDDDPRLVSFVARARVFCDIASVLHETLRLSVDARVAGTVDGAPIDYVAGVSAVPWVARARAPVYFVACRVDAAAVQAGDV